MPKRRRADADMDLLNVADEVKATAAISGSTVMAPEFNPVTNNAQILGKPEFDVLAEPQQADMVESTYIEDIFPTSQAPDAQSLEFVIMGNDKWILLNSIELFLKLRVVAADGNDIPAVANNADAIGAYPEVQLLHSLWQNVLVDVNNQNLGNLVKNYYTKAYLDTLLKTNKETQEFLKDTIGWDKDTHLGAAFDRKSTQPTLRHNGVDLSVPNAGGMAGAAVANAPNLDLAVLTQAGVHNVRLWDQFEDRINRVKRVHRGSHDFILRGKLGHYFFEQNKALIPDQNLKVTLIKARPEICMMCTNPNRVNQNTVPKVKVLEAKLLVTRQKLRADYQVAIDGALLKNPALYPLMARVETKEINVNQGVTLWNATSIVHGISPSLIVIGFVSAAKYTGAYATSFHDFEHFDLEEIYLMKDGLRYPNNGYKNLGLNDHPELSMSALPAYKALMKLGETAANPYILNISYEEWCNRGMTLFAFDLTDNNHQASLSPEIVNTTAPSNINIHAHFANATPGPLICFMYAAYDNRMEIDSQHKKVRYNFAG